MERLGPVCADWPADLFAAMVDELARITLKFEPVSSVPMYDRRSADRLIGELKTVLDMSAARRGKQSPEGGTSSGP